MCRAHFWIYALQGDTTYFSIGGMCRMYPSGNQKEQRQRQLPSWAPHEHPQFLSSSPTSRANLDAYLLRVAPAFIRTIL